MESKSNENITEIEFPIFKPHKNFDDRINDAIIRSEIEGGVSMDALPPGAVLQIRTLNNLYVVEHRGDGEILISGHPTFCPEPVAAQFHGSTWGSAMIRRRYVGRGLHLEFRHPERGIILTSPVQEIHELRASSSAGRW